jgi:hypothetical protein
MTFDSKDVIYLSLIIFIAVLTALHFWGYAPS